MVIRSKSKGTLARGNLKDNTDKKYSSAAKCHQHSVSSDKATLYNEDQGDYKSDQKPRVRPSHFEKQKFGGYRVKSTNSARQNLANQLKAVTVISVSKSLEKQKNVSEINLV